MVWLFDTLELNALDYFRYDNILTRFTRSSCMHTHSQQSGSLLSIQIAKEHTDMYLATQS